MLDSFKAWGAITLGVTTRSILSKVGPYGNTLDIALDVKRTKH